MFYDSYSAICEHFGVSPTTALRNMGISPSAYQNWKDGGNPTNPTKQKIAKYFNISIDELVEGNVKKPAHIEDERDDEMTELLEKVRRDPNLRALFSVSKNATPEDIRKTIAIMKALKGDDDAGDYS